MRIYFHNSGEPDDIQRDILPLAEGLEALGVGYFSRADYWNRDPYGADYLFRAQAEVDPRECDVIVFPGSWRHGVQADGTARQRPFPEWLFAPGRTWKTVCLDFEADGRSRCRDAEYRGFDLILRAHYNARCAQPENVRPWAIGLQNRSLIYLQNIVHYEHRVREMAAHFLDLHPLREQFLRRVVPDLEEEFGVVMDRRSDDLSQPPADAYERLMWDQTGGRHAADYYYRLAGTAMIACLAGELIPGRPHDPTPLFTSPKKAPLRRAWYHLWSSWKKDKLRLIGGDSLRFWESLVAGAVAVHVDLQAGGLALPVMPENGVHYVGINMADPDPALELLSGDREVLQEIARAGREWVLTHYTPAATAERFMGMVNQL